MGGKSDWENTHITQLWTKKSTRNHSGKVIPWTSAEHLENNLHLHFQQCSEGSQQSKAECQAQHPARESVWHPFPTPASPGKAGRAPCSTPAPGHPVCIISSHFPSLILLSQASCSRGFPPSLFSATAWSWEYHTSLCHPKV